MTAGLLRELHVPGRPLVLPNAWDADSARLVEEAGFPVVATSSVAVARSLGYGDGEQAPAAEMFAAAARIARAVSVPVTVDAESGYGLAPSELAERLLATGLAGCNLEDTDHPRGGLRDAAQQADRIAAVREAAGEDLVLNARVDVFLGASGAAGERALLPDALDRARRYLEAGADCVYPIHVRDPGVLRAFTEAVRPAAVNATYLPGGPGLADLAGLGVARISLGGGLWKATRTWLRGTLTALADGTLPY
ncbi:isocitrate lyase/PEP mutase family protein [Prauserella flavalba]|uniref:Carboxyvinyl-carboxyphosphonate phosphorylmutase n=1 Tax=Prauserella flavalba TaxID=1477506 RepID=A0A318LPD7_9PSEU|nr:isocitrate lyase/phosphoenolpyruvate mutase family protein [Prauserella flavalba]PXY34089.1 carboxyvinyl-carboxyphosphonate phosphorylmutase [Prauserella flavalba]